MKKATAQKIIKLLENIDVYPSESELLELETVGEVEEHLQDSDYFNVEIIYYSKAMDYLHEHDTSLHRGLELAQDMGYQPADLSSEILASLVASEVVREEFADIRDDIEEILDEE